MAAVTGNNVDLASIMSRVTKMIVKESRSQREEMCKNGKEDSDLLRKAYVALFEQYRGWTQRNVAVFADFQAQVRKVVRDLKLEIGSTPSTTTINFGVIADVLIHLKTIKSDIMFAGRDPICGMGSGVRFMNCESYLSRLQFVVMVVAPHVFIVDMGSLCGHTIYKKARVGMDTLIGKSVPESRQAVIKLDLETKDTEDGKNRLYGCWVIQISSLRDDIRFRLEVEVDKIESAEPANTEPAISTNVDLSSAETMLVRSDVDQDLVIPSDPMDPMDPSDPSNLSSVVVVPHVEPDGSHSYIVTIDGIETKFPVWLGWMEEYGTK